MKDLMYKKRLAIILGDDIRAFGGIERFTIELCKRLKDWDVSIFSCDLKNNLRVNSHFINKIVRGRIIKYKVFVIPILMDRVPLTLSGLKMLSDLKNYDAIYNTDPSITINLLLTMIAKINKKSFIFAVHTSILRDNVIKNSKLRKILFVMYKLVRNLILNNIPAIQVLNRYDKNQLLKIGRTKPIYKIPNFMYTGRNNKIQLNKQEFIVLFAARLYPLHKGLDLLADIITKVTEKNKAVIFRIAGNGIEGEDIIKEILIKHPKNVKWLGFLSSEQLEKEYKNANLFIITSRQEQFPLVSLEAQSYGLPLIAFNIPGPQDIIKNKFQGRLIAQFDTEKFANSILEYYNIWNRNKQDYVSIKKRTKYYIDNKYSDKIIIPKIERMLKTAKY